MYVCVYVCVHGELNPLYPKQYHLKQNSSMQTSAHTLVSGRQNSTGRASKRVSRNSLWNSIPGPKNRATRGPKWKFIDARLPRTRYIRVGPREFTHARTRWITNIVSRMRVLFHFHAGFTGRRDYQSRGRAHTPFFNLRSTTFIFVPSARRGGLRCHRGDSATVKLRYGGLNLSRWQNYAAAVA